MTARTPEEKEAFKKSLLASGRGVRPPPGTREAGLEKLLAAEAAKPAPGAGPAALRVTGAVILAVVVATWLLREPRVTAPPRAAAVDAGVVAAVVVDAGVAPPVAEVDAGPVEVVEAPPAMAVDAGKPAVVRPQPRPVEDADSLARELALLDAARGHLAANPQKSLASLDDYAREFPRGAMKTEAQLMRVETLLALGRRAEATTLARKLAAAERDGLIVRRLHQLLDGGVPSP